MQQALDKQAMRGLLILHIKGGYVSLGRLFWPIMLRRGKEVRRLQRLLGMLQRLRLEHQTPLSLLVKEGPSTPFPEPMELGGSALTRAVELDESGLL